MSIYFGADSSVQHSAAGGKILQVVNNQSSTNKSTSGDTVLELTSVTITPSSSSNWILLFFTCSAKAISSSKGEAQVRLYRGSTSGTFLGGQVGGAEYARNESASFGINFRDNPNTTSATTYTLGLRRKDSGTSYVTTDSRTYAVTALEISA